MSLCSGAAKAIAVFALALSCAPLALAANECGVGANVTCVGPTYPNGILYSNDNQTVTVNGGASTVTVTGVPNGVVLAGQGFLTANLLGDIVINTSSPALAGGTSRGGILIGPPIAFQPGSVTISTSPTASVAITTNGDNIAGINAQALGAIDIELFNTDITTLGNRSGGIVAVIQLSLPPNPPLLGADIDIVLHNSSIATGTDGSVGILASAFDGHVNVTLDASTLETTGTNSPGIAVQTGGFFGAGDAAITLSNGSSVTVSDANSTGIDIDIDVAHGVVDIDATSSLSTQNGPAIFGFAAGGIDITNAGSITSLTEAINLMRPGGQFGEISFGDDSVINTGDIEGDVLMGRGVDRFEMTGGSFAGALDMGDDDDVAHFTSVANLQTVTLFDGGTGDDSMTIAASDLLGGTQIVRWEQLNLINGARLTLNGDLVMGDLGRLRPPPEPPIDPTNTGEVFIDEASTLSAGAFVDPVIRAIDPASLVTVVNHGLIDVRNASALATNSLTIVGNYEAASDLFLNTFLGTDGSPSDKLVIDTGTASGVTGVSVFNTGGPGAQTLLDGILVVETVNGGTTEGSAFELAQRAVAGAYEYFLFRGGIDEDDLTKENNWYLRSRAEDPDPDPDPDPDCDPATDPDCPIPPPPPPVFRPEVAVYLTNARSAMGMFLHTLHERIGEPQFADDAKPADGSMLGSAWVRVVGRHNEVDPHGAYGFDTEATTWLVHGGIELADWSLADDGSAGRAHFGLMAGYGQADVDSTALFNPNPGSGAVDGYSVGAYGTFYQNEADKMGLYIDMWGQFGFFDNEITSPRLAPSDYDSWTGTASVEAGYAFKTDMDDRIVFEPQAQALYIHYNQDDFVEPNGTFVSDADLGVAMTRLGLRTFGTWVDDTGSKYEPYLELNWWHDFAGEEITLNQLRFARGIPEDRFEVGAGLNVELSPGCTLWANAEYQFGDNYEGVEGLIGVKYAW